MAATCYIPLLTPTRLNEMAHSRSWREWANGSLWRNRPYLASIAILSLFFTVTNATTFSPLSVRTSLPSAKCIMLRTTPPPAGITQVWNFSDLGSKRTRVFGRTPDSLYQTMPSTIVIPYGLDLGPPGEGHSAFILPVFVSKRPR